MKSKIILLVAGCLAINNIWVCTVARTAEAIQKDIMSAQSQVDVLKTNLKNTGLSRTTLEGYGKDLLVKQSALVKLTDELAGAQKIITLTLEKSKAFVDGLTKKAELVAAYNKVCTVGSRVSADPNNIWASFTTATINLPDILERSVVAVGAAVGNDLPAKITATAAGGGFLAGLGGAAAATAAKEAVDEINLKYVTAVPGGVAATPKAKVTEVCANLGVANGTINAIGNINEVKAAAGGSVVAKVNQAIADLKADHLTTIQDRNAKVTAAIREAKNTMDAIKDARNALGSATPPTKLDMRNIANALGGAITKIQGLSTDANAKRDFDTSYMAATV